MYTHTRNLMSGKKVGRELLLCTRVSAVDEKVRFNEMTRSYVYLIKGNRGKLLFSVAFRF